MIISEKPRKEKHLVRSPMKPNRARSFIENCSADLYGGTECEYFREYLSRRGHTTRMSTRATTRATTHYIVCRQYEYRLSHDEWIPIGTSASAYRVVSLLTEKELLALCPPADCIFLAEAPALYFTTHRDLEGRSYQKKHSWLTHIGAPHEGVRFVKLEMMNMFSSLRACREFRTVKKPLGGYSAVAIEWLREIERLTGTQIQHAENGGEYRIIYADLGNGPDRHYLADGYCAATNTVYEFHGCVYHSCPRCYPDRAAPAFRKKCTNDENYRQTEARSRHIRELGYNLVEMWECDFRALIL